MRRGLFVVGTDTAVGKTAVTCALVRAARRAELEVGAMKPVESGCRRQADGTLRPEDAVLLRAAAGDVDPLALVCPYRLEAPLAPGIAARDEGVSVEFDEIRRCFAELSSRHPDGVAVEGAGGLLVPLTAEFDTVADLVESLGLPALVIARATLGTINHTALTVEALRRRGITIRGIVLNGTTKADDPSVRGNAAAIEQLTGESVVAVLPHIDSETTGERIDQLVAILEDALRARGTALADIFR